MTETFSANRRPTTSDRKAGPTHERRANKGRREAVEALNAMKELKVRRLIARAAR